jgi:O-antigen/teichoic acid export membrane protein
VGVYSLGFKIANTLKVFIIASVNLALQPMIYKMMDHPEHKRFYTKMMTYFTYGVMFFALGLAFFGRELIKFLAQSNPDYWEAFTIVPVLILGLILGMLRELSTTGINITKRTRVYAWTILIAAVSNLGLNILLIPSFGYMGAAIATVIAQFIYFLLIFSMAQKFYHIPYELWKIITMIILGIALYLVSTISAEWNLFFRILFKSTLIIAFPFILYPFKFYEKIELERLKGFWIKWRDLRVFPSNLKDLFEKEANDNS